MATYIKSEQQLEFHGARCTMDESYVEATSEEIINALIDDGYDAIPESFNIYCENINEKVEIYPFEYLNDDDIKRFTSLVVEDL